MTVSSRAKSELPDFLALTPFVQGYIEAALFTECHIDNPELDEKDYFDFASASVAQIISDCDLFQMDNADFLNLAYDRKYEAVQAGRDFWFTRNGHGVGFWDRDELKADGLGDALTTASHGYTARDLYLGDDGKVYQS